MAEVKLVVMAVLFLQGQVGGQPAEVEWARLTHEIKTDSMEDCSNMSGHWEGPIARRLEETLRDLWAGRINAKEGEGWYIETGGVCSGPPP